MSTSRLPRFLTGAAVVVMVLAGVGFVVSLSLNAFVLDDYDAYGEVEIPGRATLHLPAGEVTISFHTAVIGGGGGLPVPKMRMGIDSPVGVPDPVITEASGGATTINNDAHAPVWVARIARAGDYGIRADGQVGAYVSPRLAFGHPSRCGWVPWWCAGAFGLGLATVVVTALLRRAH